MDSPDACYQELRGESLLSTKLQAVERLGEAGLNTILVSTVQSGVNLDQVGPIVEYGAERSWVTGVSFQPATYSGRCLLPEDLEKRVTFPDVIHELSAKTSGAWVETDFSPLPCAHPNAHTIAYAVRNRGQLLPLARFIDLQQHLDLLSGRITFDRRRARDLIAEYLSRQPCAKGGCDSAFPQHEVRRISEQATLSEAELRLAEQFFSDALGESLSPQTMFRVTTTSFMDAYNFDIRQLMKSCVHFILPTGHIIPFSAYNVLYRNGRVMLPHP